MRFRYFRATIEQIVGFDKDIVGYMESGAKRDELVETGVNAIVPCQFN